MENNQGWVDSHTSSHRHTVPASQNPSASSKAEHVPKHNIRFHQTAPVHFISLNVRDQEGTSPKELHQSRVTNHILPTYHSENEALKELACQDHIALSKKCVAYKQGWI